SGTRAALPSMFQIQSASVWTQSSKITIASGNAYFRAQAETKGSAVPPLPIDGGTLVIGATRTLQLDGRSAFTAAAGGLNGQIQISAAKILVVADEQAPANSPTGVLMLKTNALFALGAGSILIGGTATFNVDTGYTVTANATDLEVRTSGDNALRG